MAKKCPTCNSCLTILWILPNRYYYCWLCNVYYNSLDNKLTVVDVLKLVELEKTSGE